jgi:hypothetical protein
VRLLFAARGLGERSVSLIARREHREPPPPESLRLADMPTPGDWVLLGEEFIGLVMRSQLRVIQAETTGR